VVSTKGCKVLRPSDVEDELKRAAVTAVEQHDAAVEQKKGKVAEAENALTEASDAAQATARETTVATADLARFDDLASRLAFAEESYESAVRADAEAARSLAAALGELDRILGQRHSASTSLEQARKSRDNRGVPEAVLQQAMNLQAALAKAEADKHEAVQQADDTSQAARAASRDALVTLETAHTALRSGMALISSGAPDWGPGVPLPGLVANYRDRLAAAVAGTQAAEAHSKGVERAARNRLETERNDLDALDATGPVQLDAQGTIAQWMTGENFNQDDTVFADDAFARFDPEGVAALVTILAGRGCQVIYLTEDAEVLGWAIGLPHEAGGATTITNSRARKPVLVSD
jgi:DNA repair exonuclease SbcCD ATPase subunit